MCKARLPFLPEVVVTILREKFGVDFGLKFDIQVPITGIFVINDNTLGNTGYEATISLNLISAISYSGYVEVHEKRTDVENSTIHTYYYDLSAIYRIEEY